MKTKGEIEAAISEAMVGFEIDCMGRGPKEARSHIIEDLILVRLKGVLTPAEQQLAKRADGVELIKKMRSTLIESARAQLSTMISDVSGGQSSRHPYGHQYGVRRARVYLYIGRQSGQGFTA